MTEWRATCGTASASIKCKRPSWSNVSKAYREINAVGKKEYYEVLEESELHDIETYRVAELIQAQKSMKKQGGQALREFNRDSNAYINTCAFRVNYALNYGGMPLENYISRNKTKRPHGFEKATILQGEDNHNYLTGVNFMIKLFQLQEVWGDADEPYNPKIMQTEQNNINFYNNEFSKFNKNSIVAMIISGWSNATGHITLWDGEEKEFLDNSNYLIQSDCIVKELYFWEL